MTHASAPLLLRRLAAAGVALTLSAALPAGNVAAQEAPATLPATRPAALVSESQLRADVSWLADDARTGRGVNTPGLDASAEYLADRFAALGLVPPPGMDGYLQSFEFPFGNELIGEQTSLVADGGEPLGEGRDFRPLAWSKPGQFKGPLVFGGYAISSEREGYDDFAGLDARGKVVLCLRYEPHDAAGDSRFTGTGDLSREAGLLNKASAAASAGAVALLIVDPPHHHEPADALMNLGRAGRRVADIPVFHLKQRAADDLLKADGLPDLATLQDQIDRDGKPASSPGNGLAVAGGFDVRQQFVTLRNVVGVLPGETPDEYVVVGGHYDHLGVGAYGSADGEGQVHNGADDNASGTSAVLALAEAFAKNGVKPPRSMLFACFAGEEIGLVGSDELVRRGPVPPEQMVAMLNLDMVGRVREQKLSIGGAATAAAFKPIVEKADAGSPLKVGELGRGFDNRSDHASFIEAGVPALFLFSGMHEQYHAAGDDVDLVNFDGLALVTRFACDVASALLTTPREELALVKPEPAARRVRLGVTLADSPLPGYAVAAVAPDSPAAAAGLRAGDRIVKLGDDDIVDARDLVRLLGGVKIGQTVTITFEREGVTRPLRVTFDK